MRPTSIVTLIQEWTSDISGWCPEDQLFALYLLALSTSSIEGDILEVGSWCGKSSVVLAHAAEKQKCKLICLDLFPDKSDWYKNDEGNYSFNVIIDNIKYEGSRTHAFWPEPYFNDVLPVYKKNESLFDLFESNMIKKGVYKHILPVKGNTSLLSNLEDHDKNKYRLIFLDGDHSYEAVVNDIYYSIQSLNPGGWLVFDDAFSHYVGVDNAINELIINNPLFVNCVQLTRKCFAAQKAI